MPAIWYSIFDRSFNYNGTEPPFADISDLPWARTFESNFAEVKKELSQYLEKNQLRSYFNPRMMSKKDSWKTISIKSWDTVLYKVKDHFPFITSVLDKHPEIVSASFSLLEPKSRIIPHCGDTNAIYRCHLGLDIPAGLPSCGIKVKGEDKAWENGKWLAFMDAYYHEAWNDTDKERYVFIVDVMRHEFAGKRKKVCATVRTSLFMQKRMKLLKNYHSGIYVVAAILRPFIQTGIWLANKLKVY